MILEIGDTIVYSGYKKKYYIIIEIDQGDNKVITDGGWFPSKILLRSLKTGKTYKLIKKRKPNSNIEFVRR